MVNAVLEADAIGLSARALNQVRQFGEMLIELTGEMLDVPCAVLTEKILEKTGILKQYENSKDESDASRVENIKELVSAVTEFDKQYPDDGILGFLENVALVTDTDRMEEQAGIVTLMTLHSAKGLEFPAVFLTGLEEGIFPIARAMFEEEQLEEERRLMYVGITRAKRKLFISHAGSRMLFNQRQQNEISRFIGEIPGRVLEDNRIRRETARLPRSAARPFGVNAPSYSKPAMPVPNTQKPSLNSIPGLSKGFGKTVSSVSSNTRGVSLFHKGDRVHHRTLGKGTVVDVRETPQGPRADVRFDAGGDVRTFPADTAPMIKIG